MIFLSYRIEDSLPMTARLESDLTSWFGQGAVFRDMTRIPGGAEWTELLETNARSCSVMLVVIGKNWRNIVHSAGDWEGVPRLLDPEDWVRREIRLALDHNRLVIPVLLDDAGLPPVGWLTNCGLSDLAGRQARPLRSYGLDYPADLQRLIDEITSACPHLRQESAATTVAAGVIPRARGERPVPPAFHAVPPYTGSAPFTGRAADLVELDRWGRSGDPIMVVEAIGGIGKSALTWEWAERRAPQVINGLAGRVWWSFYDGSASMAAFLRDVLLYMTGGEPEDMKDMSTIDISDEVIAQLRQKPYLLVLDGFERLLAAYHRFDPSKLRDDEIEPTKRALIEPQADDVVRRLVGSAPSKVLVSTRLMPDALEGFSGPRPGVRRLRLPGLTHRDAVSLLDRLGVHGTSRAIRRFFGPLDNHPLLIGIVAGLVLGYREEPGGFNRWLKDPAAGGSLGLADLNLAQRRSHILQAALDDLSPEHRRLLDWISVLAESAKWSTLESINPFRQDGWQLSPSNDSASSQHSLLERELLTSALVDLEQRGLLWWDRHPLANSYDMHPVVRAYVHDQLGESDRLDANERIRDHFGSLPPEEPQDAKSVEDLRQTISLFRAIVGAGRTEEADWLWEHALEEALLVEIGAYATAAELLEPLAETGSSRTRRGLSIALHFLGRPEEAMEVEETILAEAVTREELNEVSKALRSIEIDLAAMGRIASSSRCLDLAVELADAGALHYDGEIELALAYRANRRGQYGDARSLLSEAERLGPGVKSPWFEGSLRELSLWLLLKEGALGEDDFATAASTLSPYWADRHGLAAVKTEFFLRNGMLEEALDAADECERLDRTAGREVVPARRGLILARLGRIEESQFSVDESLVRLGRLHPQDRPHDYLAEALWELDDREQAMAHARKAYALAWGDGPPHYRSYSDLRRARELLNRMNVEEPALPTVDPATVFLPFEAEVRALVALLKD